MLDRTFCVYKHTCPLCKHSNGIYIGITCNDPSSRWKSDGSGYLTKRINSAGREVYAQPKIANAILCYTWEAFNHEILETGLSFDDAKQKEIEYIDYFDSYAHGLNSTRGGDGFLRHLTEEARIAANKEVRRRYYQKVKTDPVRHTEIKAANAIALKKFLSNEENYSAELLRCREYKRMISTTTEGRAKAAERSRNRQHEIRDLRFKLRNLFAEYPDKFSADDISCIFDFKPNDRKHYLCMSVTKLRAILHRVEEQIENEKRKNPN